MQSQITTLTTHQQWMAPLLFTVGQIVGAMLGIGIVVLADRILERRKDRKRQRFLASQQTWQDYMAQDGPNNAKLTPPTGSNGRGVASGLSPMP